jgi:simple sugar transport system permease protein
VAELHAPFARRRMIAALAAILQSATPLIYVALGGMIAARAGIWNLGLEGLMIAGACASVVGVTQSGSIAVGLAVAVVVCALGSALLWFVIEKLRANPVIAGLGLSGLGLGGTDLAVQAIYGNEASVHAPLALPRLGPAAGDFAGCSMLVVAMPFVVAFLWVLLRRTRFGLRLSACGEHPFAARSVGVDPARMRLIALVIGGVLCALGGAELALGRLQIFSVGMTAGRGYMAFAAVSFGAMNPIGSALAAAFFAVVEYLGIKGQLAFGNAAPPELILSLPYLATVLGVWLSSRIRGSAATISELREY